MFTQVHQNFITICLLLLTIHVLSAQNYYVDYDLGNDLNSGLTEADAWKHCPGDKNATGIANATILSEGSTVFFKGNTKYRGSININGNGSSSNKVRYVGNAWGNSRAILDGGLLLNNWTDEGSGIYSTPIPSSVSHSLPGSFNLQQFINNETKRLNVTQYPQSNDPFFFDDITNYNVVKSENLSLQSIRDDIFFNQTNPDYWNGSSVLIFINPNLIEERKIKSFDPTINTIYFDALPPNAIYPDGRDQYYSIFNSNHYLIQDGSYFIDFDNQKIFINPVDEDLQNNPIGYSNEKIGFNLNNKNNIEISGFEIKFFGGDTFIDGIGIGKSSFTQEPTTGISILNNVIHENRNGTKGNGGIYLPNCSEIKIKDNLIQNNMRNAGIFTTNGSNILIESNTIVKCGSTNIRLYVVSDAMVINNKIYEARGRHANGITAYLGCHDILFASNQIYDAITPITFQNSGNLYFHNNIIDSYTYSAGISEWGRTSNENCTNGVILITNNTILTTENKPAIVVEKSLSTTTQGNQEVGPNQYYSYNNILDAGGLILNPENSDYNLYTSLSWQQVPPWSANTNEIIGSRDFENLFYDYPNNYNLLSNSQATGKGQSILALLPIDKFPHYDFNKDIYNNQRPTTNWSIGASETEITNSTRAEQKNLDFTIHPNPSNGNIHISIKDDLEIFRYEVFSFEGRLIYAKQSSHPIFNPNINAGIYILKITLKNGEILTSKFKYLD